MDDSKISYQTEGDLSTSDLLENIASIEEFPLDQYKILAKDLDAQLRTNGAPLASNENELRQTLVSVLKQQNTLQEKRSHGWHKGAATFQQFATCLSKVLDNFAPIADMAQDSGVPYAKLGFQVLAHLLVIPRAKSTVDNSIYIQLKQICDAFPRIEILKKIYDSPQLRNPFAQMHIGMVYWAVDAGNYLSSRTERFKAVVMGSPTDDTFEKLMKILMQISHWTSTFMHRNIAGMKSQVEELGREAALSEQRLQRLHEQIEMQTTKLDGVAAALEQHSSRLENIKTDITQQSSTLNGVKTEQNLARIELAELRTEEANHRRQGDEDRYEVFVEALSEGSHPACGHEPSQLAPLVNKSLEFRANPLGGKFKTQAWSAEVLAGYTEFQKWQCSAGSKMLVLGTEESPRTNTGYSWVSSGPLSFAHELQLQERKDGEPGRVALHSCHPDSWLLDDSAPDFVDIVTNIVVQVVRNDKALLRNKELRNIDGRTKKKWRREWDKGETDKIIKDVGQVFNMASRTKPLHIIVDRLDKCRNFEAESTELLEAFERLAHASANTKILITLWFERETINDAYKSFVDRHDVVVGDVRLKSEYVNERRISV